MISSVLKELDVWINQENLEARQEGSTPLKVCTIQVVGQNALLEANLDLHLAATVDLDAYVNASSAVLTKLRDLLQTRGLVLDPLSSEIWMPTETVYADIWRGDWVIGQRALPEFVMASKAKMAFDKNRNLIQQYIASEPPMRFFDLCDNYQINLEQ
jgi:hypothetical protein